EVVALEKKIAAAQWSEEDQRDPVKNYNPKTPAELAALAPGVPWPAYAAAAQLPAGSTVIVQQPSYETALAKLLASEPLDQWKLYLKARRLDDTAATLPQAFRDAAFEMQKAVRGVKQQKPRWQDAMRSLDGALGEAIGERYVAKYFPPEAKARAQAVV